MIPTPVLAHLPGLDGLRGVAVTIVMAHHISYGRLPGGFLGVQLFFVLSGYLITLMLLREWRAMGRIALARFYARRALRLLPALVLTVGMATLIGRLAIPGSPKWPWGQVAALLYVANFTNFFHPDVLGMLGHTWSLAIEEQFYLLWPPLLLILLRLTAAGTGSSASPWVMRVSGVLAVTSLGTALLLYGLLSTPAAYWLTPLHAFSLLCGSCLAVLGRHPRLPVVGGRMATVLASLAILVLAVLVLRVDRNRSGWWLYVAVVLATGASLLLVHLTALRSCRGLTYCLEAWPSAYVGRISYGLYLYHLPVFIAAEVLRVRGDIRNYIAVSIGAVTVAVAMAVLSYELVEGPALRLKARLR